MKETDLIFQEDLEKALNVLKRGGLILYPTDTVWGLGCDATNPEAIRKIYELKKREDSKSLIVLIDSLTTLKKYILNIPESALKLIKDSIVPTTIIYNNASGVADNIKAEDDSLAIRITNESFSKKLCEKFNKPIISTSANISGKPTPHNYSEISSEIKNGVDYIVKYRQNDQSSHNSSKIVKLTDLGNIIVLRD